MRLGHQQVAREALGALAIALPFNLITFGELEVPSGLTAVLIAPASLFVAAFAPFVDGVIVGSDRKRDGGTWNPVERERVRRFLAAAREA